MKTAFIIFLLIISSSAFSQERKPQVMNIHLLNSEGEYVENAVLSVDSILATYNPANQSYSVSGTFDQNFNIIVFAEGYETLNYKSKDLPYSINSDEISMNLYLIRPGEKYFYYQKQLKYPYIPREDELLVVLKPKEIIVTDSCISEFENSIKKQGLIVHKTFLEPPHQNTKEYMKYSSLSPSIRKKIIVKKQDGTTFDANYCHDLAFLRLLDQVDYAGPVIMTNDSYLDAFTFNHFIKLDNPLENIDSTKLNKILKEIDVRYFYDERKKRIVLPPETNENVPQIMEKIYESGIDETFNMAIMKFKRKAGIDLNQSLKSISSDTLESNYLTIGGKKMTFNKDFSRIGIVFESNYSDYSTFIAKYNLTHDSQYNYRNFTVFRFTENLSIEKREEIIELVKEEKHVEVVGDLLISNQGASIITDKIIVQWKETDSEEIIRILRKENLSKQMGLKGNRMHLKVQNPFNYRVVEVCNKLLNSGLVDFAEPDLFSPVILD